jgi:hypothetical protein
MRIYEESGVRCLCKGGSLDVSVWNVPTRMHQSRLSDCALTVGCLAQSWVVGRGLGVVSRNGSRLRGWRTAASFEHRISVVRAATWGAAAVRCVVSA